MPGRGGRGDGRMREGTQTMKTHNAASHGVRSACVVIVTFTLVLSCLLTAQAGALTASRVYEQVSPPYKGGYPVLKLRGIAAVASDGNRIVFASFGSFAGAPAGTQPSQVGVYYAYREPLGWRTVADMVPAAISEQAPVTDYSPSLELQVALAQLGANSGASFESKEAALLLHRPGNADDVSSWEGAGSFILEPLDEQIHEPPEYSGASRDLCHLIFRQFPLRGSPAEITKTQLYNLARGCAGEQASLTVVAVNNSGHELVPNCAAGPDVGDARYSEATGPSNAFNAVAAGGSEVFVTICTGASGSTHQLFARLGAERTLEVSRPTGSLCVGEGSPHVVGEVPCQGATARASANFQGASEDGSRVFFTTTAPLAGTDNDIQNDLYMAAIGCPGGEECKPGEREVTSLTQVSRTLKAEAADVQGGVIAMSPDGSRVYFVARGVLSEEGPSEAGAQSLPVAGADNLYVFDGVLKETLFVGDLCSGSRTSGSVQDAHCPTSLNGVNRNDDGLLRAHDEAQVTGDGRFLVFSTFAQLSKNDIDNARDVYRYDALEDKLTRVSVGEDGYHVDGNGEDGAQSADASIAQNEQSVDSTAEQHGMTGRAISEEGSQIVFASAEQLSAAAVNGHVNVYEWNERQRVADFERHGRRR